jgi:hypothetical protein
MIRFSSQEGYHQITWKTAIMMQEVEAEEGIDFVLSPCRLSIPKITTSMIG